MDGELGILNVGAGDTKLTFDPEKPEERKRAAAAVTEMLRLGFAILVQVGEKDGKPIYMRADGFDEATCEYLIVGVPPEDIDIPGDRAAVADVRPPVKLKNGGKAPKTRVPAHKTSAVSVGRSAGG
jgi:hypothetical protein